MNAAAKVRHEPAVYFVTVLGTLVALIVAFAHLSQTDAAYLGMLATGLGTIITALLAQPRHVAVIGGAAADILQSLVLFKIHMSSGEQAAILQAVALLTGYLAMRPNLTPDHSD